MPRKLKQKNAGFTWLPYKFIVPLWQSQNLVVHILYVCYVRLQMDE